MKVHKGRAQTNKAMAVGSRSASSGAAEKMLATAPALKVTRRAISSDGQHRDHAATSLTAPCAASSSSRVGTTRCSASGMERWMKLVTIEIAPQSTT